MIFYSEESSESTEANSGLTRILESGNKDIKIIRTAFHIFKKLSRGLEDMKTLNQTSQDENEKDTRWDGRKTRQCRRKGK